MPLLIPVVDCVTSLRTVKLIEDPRLGISFRYWILAFGFSGVQASLHHFYMAAVTSMNRLCWLGIDAVKVLFISRVAGFLPLVCEPEWSNAWALIPFWIFPWVPINRLEDAFLFVDFSWGIDDLSLQRLAFPSFCFCVTATVGITLMGLVFASVWRSSCTQSMTIDGLPCCTFAVLCCQLWYTRISARLFLALISPCTPTRWSYHCASSTGDI